MSFWSKFGKSQWALTIFGRVGATLIAAAVLAAIPPIRHWTFAILRDIWQAIIGWFATTIHVSRGQCFVWFLVGFGTYAAVVAVNGLRKLMRAALLKNLGGDELLVLRAFAENGGSIFDLTRLSQVLRLSPVRVTEIVSRLTKLGLVDDAWATSLTESGRRFVISKGWA